MTGGVTALAAALVLGPRMGRFYDRDGNPLEEPHDFPPHSVALQFLGTFCLWCVCCCGGACKNLGVAFLDAFINTTFASLASRDAGLDGMVSTPVPCYRFRLLVSVRSQLLLRSTLLLVPVLVLFLPCLPRPLLTSAGLEFTRTILARL